MVLGYVSCFGVRVSTEIAERFRESVKRLVLWSEVFRGASLSDVFWNCVGTKICRTYGALNFSGVDPSAHALG